MKMNSSDRVRRWFDKCYGEKADSRVIVTAIRDQELSIMLDDGIQGLCSQFHDINFCKEAWL